MRILYITLSDPRLNEQGIYPDLMHELKKRGHDIVICFADSPGNIDHTLMEEQYGIKVLRVLVGENFNVGLLKKGINTIKMGPYLKGAIRKYLRDERFDLCLYATPPVTFAQVVSYCKKLYNAKTFLMLKDIFPQNAVDIGLFRENSIIHKYFLRKERKLYSISDKIGCMSEGNVEYIKKHDPFVDPDKLLVFPNTIKVRNTDDQHKETENGEKVRFIFGGNLGKPQALDFLLASIADERLKNRKDIEFLIVGKGSEEEKVREAAKQFDNLTYMEHMPADEYNRFMKGCDVGMILLDHRFTIPNYPSRILGIMEMKKPVLACTDRNTDIRLLVESEAKCGLWSSSDDRESFVGNVLRLSDDADLRVRLGNNGYRYLKENFTAERSADIIEGLFAGKVLSKGEKYV